MENWSLLREQVSGDQVCVGLTSCNSNDHAMPLMPYVLRFLKPIDPPLRTMLEYKARRRSIGVADIASSTN